jgi:membrane protein
VDRPGPAGLAQRVPDRARRAGHVLLATIRAAAQDRITQNAASLAFHLFLAVFPAALAAIGAARLVGLPPGALQRAVHDAQVLLPAQVAQVVDQALTAPSAKSTDGIELAAGVLVALWSAVEAMASLQVGLDVACEVRRDRGFVGRRLWALPLLGATVVLGGAATGLLVLGDPIRRLLPASVPLARPAAAGLFDLLRFAGALACLLLLFSTFYALGPHRERLRWRWVTPGSALAATFWLAASAGFAFYLDHFGHESRTYGAFAGVAILALWLFLTATAVLFGAELDTVLERSAPDRRPSPALGQPARTPR